jgi:DNA adenine methylase
MKEDDLLSALMSMQDEETVREDLVKAPFSYPGGKNTGLPNILPHLPNTDYYCEPFGGSGVVLLARKPCKNEVFNDRYSGVTDFYKCVKDRVLLERLLGWLDMTQHSREMFVDARDTWENASDPVERAGKWFYMTVNSFQSYGRHFGRSKTAANRFAMNLPSRLSGFWPVHYRLQGVTIENQDWRQMFADFDHHSRVWYLDPPYVPDSTGSNLGGMYKHLMSRNDHTEMCERIFRLEGYVALSGYPNDIYSKYPWDKVEVWEQRETSSAKIGTASNNRIGHEGGNNGVRTECLYIKDFK